MLNDVILAVFGGKYGVKITANSRECRVVNRESDYREGDAHAAACTSVEGRLPPLNH